MDLLSYIAALTLVQKTSQEAVEAESWWYRRCGMNVGMHGSKWGQRLRTNHFGMQALWREPRDRDAYYGGQ